MRALEILDRITSGEAEMSDLDELETLAIVIKDTSLCGLGQTAPNPVLSTIKYFRDEYIEHIVNKKCRSGVCAGLFDLIIDDEPCISCGKCLRGCAFDAITVDENKTYFIHTDLCTGCRACITACPTDAIEVIKMVPLIKEEN